MRSSFSLCAGVRGGKGTGEMGHKREEGLR
jgi:hypothetical protein